MPSSATRALRSSPVPGYDARAGGPERNMKVKASHRYTQDAQTVYAAFCDPAFYQAKFEGVGARNVRVVKQEKKPGRFHIETEREMRVDVPGVLKAVLGEWNRLRQSERWSGKGGEYHNEIELSSPGVPVTMRGTMDLVPAGKGCVNEVEIEIRCDLPFIGKKLAELVASSTERGLADEHAFIRSYLVAGKRKQKKRE